MTKITTPQSTIGQMNRLSAAPMTGTEISCDNKYLEDVSLLRRSQLWYVCHRSEISNAGQFVSREILNEPFVLIRQDDGSIRAFMNMCLHRNARIVRSDKGQYSQMVCPYHGWKYGTDGRLMEARGCESLNGTAQLEELTIVEVAGMIFVSLDRDAAPTLPDERIVQTLKDAGYETAVHAYTNVMQTQTNWKLWVENFLECHHCHAAHPQLKSIEGHISQFEAGEYQTFFSEQAQWKSKVMQDGWTAFDKIEADPDSRTFEFMQALALGGDRYTSTQDGQPIGASVGEKSLHGGLLYGALTPFLHFSAYDDHAVLFEFIPTAVDQTDVRIHWFVDRETEMDIERLTWLWNLTLAQDMRLTENVQINAQAHNRATGLYLEEEEARSALFARWVRNLANTQLHAEIK